ncbi:hypothetical protein A3197_12635 [Candidatus Thiodiazotropha endoloripes]|nr:hypothetical protein A3197_12635 [Candidatus Thiodiazotropha endoloripes]
MYALQKKPTHAVPQMVKSPKPRLTIAWPMVPLRYKGLTTPKRLRMGISVWVPVGVITTANGLMDTSNLWAIKVCKRIPIQL